MCALCYADDIVLIAPDAESMHELMQTTTDYARKWRFRFNNKKSEVVIFGTPQQQQKYEEEKWELGRRNVKMIDEYEYLGIEMTNTRKRWTSVIERMTEKAERQKTILRRQMGVRASRQLFKTIVIPIWEFGIQIWKGTKKQMKTLEGLQGAFARRILGLSPRATNAVACTEAAIKSVQTRIDELILRWYQRVTTADRTRLLRHVCDREKRASNEREV